MADNTPVISESCAKNPDSMLRSAWRSARCSRSSWPVLLVGVRGEIVNANIALILVLVVVLAAVAGGWRAGALSAVSAALSFDFFHTKPYLSLSIASQDDVETTVLLLAVGLAVGYLASRARVARGAAAAGRAEIRRIHRIAELAAQGSPPAEILVATQQELVGRARLAALPLRSAAVRSAACARRAQRNGHRYHRASLRRGELELPREGVELPVLAAAADRKVRARPDTGRRACRSSKGSWPSRSPIRWARSSPPRRKEEAEMADIRVRARHAGVLRRCAALLRARLRADHRRLRDDGASQDETTRERIEVSSVTADNIVGLVLAVLSGRLSRRRAAAPGEVLMSAASWAQFVVFVALVFADCAAHRLVHGQGVRRRARRRRRAIGSSSRSSARIYRSAASTREQEQRWTTYAFAVIGVQHLQPALAVRCCCGSRARCR